MTKDKDRKTIVPPLRFPEFRGAEGWSNVRLIDVADKKTKWHFTGGPFGSNLKASDYTSSGVRVIQLQNIGDGSFVDDYKIYTSLEKSDELLSCNIYPGDIIISKMGDPVGRACLIPENEDRYLMCSDGIRLVVDECKNDKYFIFTIINDTKFRAKIERNSTGSTRKRIGLDTLRDLILLIPDSKEEQQKIAECLGSLDDLISAVADKIEALKLHKKGLMQQLFPAEGKTTPSLRFPEFQNAGEWEETTLESLCKSIASGKNKNNPNGAYDLYGSTGIIGKTDYGDYDGLYILVARVGANAGFLTKVSGVFGVTDNTLVINPKSGIVFDFIYYLLSNLGLNNLVFGSGQPLITGSQLKNLSVGITLPTEQRKIADCLSSVDNLISAETDKLDQLKAHKKGLMQQLFPTINE